MTTKIPHIALLIMMKDEEKRLYVTLESCLGYINSIVAYDTGSTDNTIKILKDFSDKNKIPLRLKEGIFVNFSVSRNISLDFADSFEDIDFILLLDVNDELRGGDNLMKICKQEMNTDNTKYLVCQQWFSGTYTKYFNTRLIKARKKLRYKGSVHEWLCDMSTVPTVCHRLTDDIVIYQDRTKDENKSSKRFLKDKELLLLDYKENPLETRTLFYLAQTYDCLNQHDEAFYYYRLRSELDGFQEEKFQSYLKCGEISQKLKHSWYNSLEFYMKAIEHSNRVEPLIKIIEYYKNQKNWLLAYTFVNLACDLPYPINSILFVDKQSYDYTRWHLMGIVAYYCHKYEDGKNGCIKAIEAGLNIDLDKSNLIFYEEKDKEKVI